MSTPKKPEPPLDFSWLPYAALQPWDRNPRINDHVVERVARSIARFGFIRPITIWTSRNRMVAGHTALKAFKRIVQHGFTDAAGVRIPPQPQFCAKGAPAPAYLLSAFTSSVPRKRRTLTPSPTTSSASWQSGMTPCWPG